MFLVQQQQGVPRCTARCSSYNKVFLAVWQGVPRTARCSITVYTARCFSYNKMFLAVWQGVPRTARCSITVYSKVFLVQQDVPRCMARCSSYSKVFLVQQGIPRCIATYFSYRKVFLAVQQGVPRRSASGEIHADRRVGLFWFQNDLWFQCSLGQESVRDNG